jgi:hypothetical protein
VTSNRPTSGRAVDLSVGRDVRIVTLSATVRRPQESGRSYFVVVLTRSPDGGPPKSALRSSSPRHRERRSPSPSNCPTSSRSGRRWSSRPPSRNHAAFKGTTAAFLGSGLRRGSREAWAVAGEFLGVVQEPVGGVGVVSLRRRVGSLGPRLSMGPHAWISGVAMRWRSLALQVRQCGR